MPDDGQKAEPGTASQEGLSVKGVSGGGNGGGRSPLLEGLLNELPAERTEWGIEDRVSWLELATAIFERVYGKTGQRIKIELAGSGK